MFFQDDLRFFIFYYREEWNILIELAEDEREWMWNDDFMDDWETGCGAGTMVRGKSDDN